MRKLEKRDLKKVLGGCLYRGKGNTYIVKGTNSKGEKIKEKFGSREFKKALRCEWDNFREKYPFSANIRALGYLYNNGDFSGEYDENIEKLYNF